MLDGSVHHFVGMVSKCLYVDTQEIEGLNNTIKRVGQLAPNMSWELLAARVTIKKRVLDLQSMEERDAFVRHCVANHAAALALLRSDDAAAHRRFAVVAPDLFPAVAADAGAEQQPVRSDIKCTSKIISAIRKAFRDAFDTNLTPDAEVFCSGGCPYPVWATLSRSVRLTPSVSSKLLVPSFALHTLGARVAN
jgi:hypothetical protein